MNCMIAVKGTLQVWTRYKDKGIDTGTNSRSCHGPGNTMLNVLHFVGGDFRKQTLATAWRFASSTSRIMVVQFCQRFAAQTIQQRERFPIGKSRTFINMEGNAEYR